MENVEKATGYINFGTNGERSNYTIHIHRSAFAMPLGKVVIRTILENLINLDLLIIDWFIFYS